MKARSGCFLVLMGCLSLSACQDVIAPINDSAIACVADADCLDGFFCTSGRCLRASGIRCGNGQVEGEEKCDDGNRNPNDQCVGCQIARCGDGAVQLGLEACDEGDGVNADDQADRCRLDCQSARCGDGTLDTGEACDDGALNNNEVGDRCRVDCTMPRCGDSVIDQGEQCDDANTDPTDACASNCQSARCGDGIVRADLQEGEPGFEYCDDGNLDDEDDCDRYCGQGILSAATSNGSSCVVKHNGSVWCWGSVNQQDDAHWTLRPKLIQLPGRVVELSALRHNIYFARTEDGKVYTWDSGLPSQVSLSGRSAVRLVLKNPRYDLHNREYINSYICTSDGTILKGNPYRQNLRLEEVIEGPAQGMIDCGVGESRHHNWRATYCALTPERQLYCWGENGNGLVGNGTENPVDEPYRVPLDHVRDFAVGATQACALDRAHDLYCWGRTETGDQVVASPLRIQGVPRLGALWPAWRADTGAWLPRIGFDVDGNGRFANFYNQRRALGEDFSHVVRPRFFVEERGEWHNTVFVIDETFRLWARGSDLLGKAGVGKAWRYEPVRVEGLANASTLAPGAWHSCAWGASDRHVHCWGGHTTARHANTARGTTQAVRNGDPPTWVGEASGLGSGMLHSCLIDPDHNARCWGNGHVFDEAIRPEGDWSPEQVVVGGSPTRREEPEDGKQGHQCVLDDGIAYCWGDNHFGQTGQGDVQGDLDTPRQVLGLPLLSSLSLGAHHSCALSQVGEVWCWGDNQFGQLGQEGVEMNYLVERVNLPFEVAQLSAGTYHTCVRAQAGTVHCWGGEGNPTGLGEIEGHSDFEAQQPRNAEFLAVPQIEDAIWLSSGTDFACAVLGGSAEVVCWAGAPNWVTGQRVYEGLAPRTIPGLPAIQMVEAGHEYACALTQSGETWCWGDNHTNQLGDQYAGESLPEFVPVDRFDQEWSDRE